MMKVEFDKLKALNALLYAANKLQRKDFHKIFKILAIESWMYVRLLVDADLNKLSKTEMEVTVTKPSPNTALFHTMKLRKNPMTWLGVLQPETFLLDGRILSRKRDLLPRIWTICYK